MMVVMAREAGSTPTVIRISPMAHFASAFLALALLVLVPALGTASLALMVIPVLISVAVERLRTTADQDTVTARTLTGSHTLAWSDIDGLKFTRGGWARACRDDPPGDQSEDGGKNRDVLLPAVTFATLPVLTAASDGKVPNPYRR